MTQGQNSKRAQRRLRGKQQSEAKLQTARQACQSFPAAVPLGRAPVAQHESGVDRTLSFAPPALPASPNPTRRAPVGGRVRIALETGTVRATARPLIPFRPVALAHRANAPARTTVDTAAIARHVRGTAEAERRRSMAAMLVASLALGSLIAVNPFGAPRPDQPGRAPQIAALPIIPEASPPTETSRIAIAPVVPAEPAVLPPSIDVEERKPVAATPEVRIAGLPPIVDASAAASVNSSSASAAWDAH